MQGLLQTEMPTHTEIKNDAETPSGDTDGSLGIHSRTVSLEALDGTAKVKYCPTR